MRKNLTNNPVHQMPQISCKRGFGAKSLFHLPSDRFVQPTFACQRAAGSEFSGRIINFAKIISHNEYLDDIISKFHFRPPCQLKVIVHSPLISAMRSFFVLTIKKLAQRVKF